MDVSEAVRRAKQAAREYSGEHAGVRVEEVERTVGGDWNITLSWLEEDVAERLRAQADPLRRIGLRPEPPALERVYRVFEVRGADAVRMKRAPEP